MAHWKMDEMAAPFADSGGYGIPLGLDIDTTMPTPVAGADSGAAQLRWETTPGVSTRLIASSPALQTDSFGFSFWLHPVNLAPFENLIGKEMFATTSGPNFSRLAWQVQVLGDNGSGAAVIEFLVRGSDRTQGDFFGSVQSTVTVPLHTDAAEWFHVAGGYNAATGRLVLFVNGVETSTNGTPGARNSDGGAFAVGTMVNGSGFVAFAAIAGFDDVQLYDTPLSTYEVAQLRTFPGRAVQRPFAITGFSGSPTTNLFTTFNSIDGWFYGIDVARNLTSYTSAGTFQGVGQSTTVTVSKQALDEALSTAPKPRVFSKVRAYLEDPIDGSLNLPPADIVPFSNTGSFVPQFHFSLPGAAVGDPCGVVRWQNKYHLFTWDHASSSDLVSWDFLGWPMRDGPADSGIWTGSVVVDKQNTSGFGSLVNPPMVAIYTIHNNTTGKETIGISRSTNQRDFFQYSGNPVLSTSDQVFRDPEVFWHAPTNRWIMLVARSEAQAIAFYSSTDLKSWQWMSEFGVGLGAQAEIWETPGLVEVPIKGWGNRKKWLLFCGAGSNKVQYWVGHFDGTHFTMDVATQSFLENGTGLDGDVFANFEGGDYNALGWVPAGSAFGSAPGNGPPARGYLGQRLASSYVDGDFHTGSTLTSPQFTITKKCINFLIAGGNHPGQTCLNLLVGGNVVRTATGGNSDLLRWAGWSVGDLIGQTARLQLVDDFGGFWGRIFIDHILFSDTLNDQRREHANWVDFGSDFFAPRVVRDYDGIETDTKWLGWIGNWNYEAQRPVPPTWGKGAESIFRKLLLARSPRGYELVQRPIVAQQRLRGPVSSVPSFVVQGIVPVTQFQPLTNTYEIEAVFERGAANQHAGLNLCVGGGNKVVIGFDGALNNVWLDRTVSGNVSFHSAFPNVVHAPLKSATGPVKFRIFVDQCSIEVFVNDGERVLTSQIYPNPAKRGVELFSSFSPSTLPSFKAWPLASIW